MDASKWIFLLFVMKWAAIVFIGFSTCALLGLYLLQKIICFVKKLIDK